MLSNAAREPEIEDLQGFLNTCGAEMQRRGHIHGGGSPGRTAPPRRYLHRSAGPHRGGHLPVRRRPPPAARSCSGTHGSEHLSAVTAVLREAGCDVTGGSAGIVCRRTGRSDGAPGPIRTAPYPGFPTDAQAILMAALLRCRGAAVFEENLFSSRYRHVDELARMGADIRVSGRTAVVLGVERLHGAAVRCTDLRGGAALCAAALAAEGETSISDITHIDRGYQSIEDDLAALGRTRYTAGAGTTASP